MRRNCPEWFQDRLTRAGGLNPYGEPNFKLIWGQSETMRDGGYFLKDGYVGYRDVPAIGGEACWALMMWEPNWKFGTPYRWYKDNTDEVTGLVTLGQFPYQGRYRVLKKFIHRELIGDQWVTTRMEPTHFIADIMLPLIKLWHKLTDAEKLKVIEAEQEAEEAEKDRILKDSWSAMRIRRSSPAVQKRLELMEKTMNQAMALAARTQLGMRQAGV